MTNQQEPIWTKSFISIAITNFFIFVVFYALLTLLPIYVLDALDGTSTQAGLVVTIFLLSAIIVRPFSGKVIENIGKKKTLVFSTLIFALSSFLYMLIHHFNVLLLLRFFQGISFSLATTVTGAIAADLVPAKRRGEGLGYFGMSMNLAVVAGPFLALTLHQYMAYNIIFLVFGVIMLVGWLCGMMVKNLQENAAPSVKKSLSLSDLFEKKSMPISSVGILVSFSYASIISFISVYAQSLGLIKTASFFFVVFAAAMLISRPFTGRLFDKAGPNIVIIPSCIVFAIGLFSLSLTHSSWMLLFSGALVGLGYGTLLPSFQTLAIQAAPAHRSAYATATFFTFYDSGIAVGSFVLGIAAGALGYSKLYFALGIFVLLITLYYKWIANLRQKQKAANIQVGMK
ncbi:MFS transporter [Priestia megaterium]|uniref:MFS transporter n=1 Tax=Priestia megaterium TaxID=1404 RepID=UPI002E1FB6E5|nr:MFS transporter [Priestia megaterium]